MKETHLEVQKRPFRDFLNFLNCPNSHKNELSLDRKLTRRAMATYHTFLPVWEVVFISFAHVDVFSNFRGSWAKYWLEELHLPSLLTKIWGSKGLRLMRLRTDKMIYYEVLKLELKFSLFFPLPLSHAKPLEYWIVICTAVCTFAFYFKPKIQQPSAQSFWTFAFFSC